MHVFGYKSSLPWDVQFLFEGFPLWEGKSLRRSVSSAEKGGAFPSTLYVIGIPIQIHGQGN